MQQVNIIVRDARTVETIFSVLVPQDNEPAIEVVRTIIDPIIHGWTCPGQASNAITSGVNALGLREITVQLVPSGKVRRPAVSAASKLKIALDQKGLTVVNPSVVRSYSTFEDFSDVGLPFGKPAGGVV